MLSAFTLNTGYTFQPLREGVVGDLLTVIAVMGHKMDFFFL